MSFQIFSGYRMPGYKTQQNQIQKLLFSFFQNKPLNSITEESCSHYIHFHIHKFPM